MGMSKYRKYQIHLILKFIRDGISDTAICKKRMNDDGIRIELRTIRKIRSGLKHEGLIDSTRLSGSGTSQGGSLYMWTLTEEGKLAAAKKVKREIKPFRKRKVAKAKPKKAVEKPCFAPDKTLISIAKLALKPKQKQRDMV